MTGNTAMNLKNEVIPMCSDSCNKELCSKRVATELLTTHSIFLLSLFDSKTLLLGRPFNTIKLLKLFFIGEGTKRII
jgi:hypothetical protein